MRFDRTAIIASSSTVLLVIAAAALWVFSVGPYRAIGISAGDIPVAAPAALAAFDADPAVSDRDAWLRRRPRLLQAFEGNIYGDFPAEVQSRVRRVTPIAAREAAGVEGVEQWNITLGEVGDFNLVLVAPRAVMPAPVIILQNYCGNRAAFPGHPRAIAAPLQRYPSHCASAVFRPVHQALFGEWIDGPPFGRITARGYAVAIFYGGDLVPDNARDAPAALSHFGATDTGAVSAWAWMTSRIVDVLRQDSRFDPDRMIAWGQSRYGKAALLAGAMDQRIAAVVALQSGRGGDALTRHRAGESVRSITGAFPYWFSPRFAAYASRDPPVDQHQLLALVAPRPLLLGYARRDGWADPAGGIGALRGAQPVYDLLRAPRPQFYVREGRHGVTTADWDETLRFLDHVLQE